MQTNPVANRGEAALRIARAIHAMELTAAASFAVSPAPTFSLDEVGLMTYTSGTTAAPIAQASLIPIALRHNSPPPPLTTLPSHSA